jgi:protein involved in polysaccharide export with SLBB domain
MDPRSAANVVLVDGASIHVPDFDPTVLVTGAVTFESRVLWRPGDNIHDYIRRSGGFAHNADTRRITILYPNGARESVRRTLGVTRRPPVQPGSTIFVAERSEDGFNLDRFISRIEASALATLALIAVISQLR